MTPSANSASAPRRPQRRGTDGRAASSLPGDQRLAALYAELQTILRLELIWLAVQHQLSEIRVLADAVTGAIPARAALVHLRRLRRHQKEVAALVLPVAGAPVPRRRLRRASGTNPQFRSPVTKEDGL